MLWLTMAMAGTVPFLASSLDLSLTDAIFESVSGVTTTGSTILNGLDQAPPGILMWRSLLSFMGGLGVIALGLFLLPFLNIGGVSYFKIESSDIEDRPFERFQTFTLSLIGIYATLVFTCAVCYVAAGMEGFHASTMPCRRSPPAASRRTIPRSCACRQPCDPVGRLVVHVHRQPALLDHDPVHDPRTLRRPA